MVAHRCDRIHGALHCVCIWNRGALLSVGADRSEGVIGEVWPPMQDDGSSGNSQQRGAG